MIFYISYIIYKRYKISLRNKHNGSKVVAKTTARNYSPRTL